MSPRLGLAFACLLAACSQQRAIGGRFPTTAQPDEPKIAKELSLVRPRAERAVVVAILEENGRLAMWDLASAASWTTAVSARSAPVIAGDAIVLEEADGISVRDLATGKLRAALETKGRLIGADGVGSKVVISLREAGASASGEVALFTGDHLDFRVSLHLPTGIPALVGPYVVVPWASQRLSVLSSRDGSELARYEVPSLVVGSALVRDGTLFFGEQQLVPFTSDLHKDGPRLSAAYAPVKRALPGQPPLVPNGYEPVPDLSSASHRLAVDFELAHEAGASHARAGLLVERFYRSLLGFAADQPDLLFVQTFDQDLVTAEVTQQGVLSVDQAGTLRLTRADGATSVVRELGARVKVATLRPAAVTVSEEGASAPGKVHDDLLALIRLADARLLPLRSWAVERLAEREEPTVTAELLALCEDQALGAALSTRACERLATRKDGQQEILVALARHGSFLEGTSAPPLGALADAAAHMKLRSAGPLLISHLEDVSTKVSELPQVCAALVALEHRPATTSLERFVRIHHAEPPGTDVGPALLAAIDALGGLHAKSAAPTLHAVVDDLLAAEPVRERARTALRTLEGEAQQTPPPSKTQASKETLPEEVLPDPRPWSLSADDVALAFKRMRRALLGCLAASKTSAARVSLVVTDEGKVEGLFVTPTTAQSCMDPFLRTAPFPKTRQPRQHITQTLRADR